MPIKFTLKHLFYSSVVLIAIVALFIVFNRPPQAPVTESLSPAFKESGLMTNTAVASIPLEKVLDGGPGKDGIPAINNPKFITADKVSKNLTDQTQGMLVTVKNTTRFYPYTILVWHEIVNDTIEGKSLTITFCPLCGSAIVFEAEVKGEALQFGVSGKLYESNLLMYDRKTESLWSQILGEAVVGDMTGTKLTLYRSSVLTFGEAKKLYPKLEVLSEDTGHRRDYSFYPYGGYDTNDEIYFPLSIRDTRLPAKEIMYIVNVDDTSVAFVLSDLKERKVATVEVNGKNVTAEVKNSEIEVRHEKNQEILPGYYAMWFSWAIHHQKDGVVWRK